MLAMAKLHSLRAGKHFRTHVLAYVALFFALGGTSFAVARGPGRAAKAEGWQVVSASKLIPIGQTQHVSALCPLGKRPTGGGFVHEPTIQLLASGDVPSTTGQVGWVVVGKNRGSRRARLSVKAICVDA